ncbi:hypothetical protein RJT34_11346 [Clitoria ternatea]|uniref:Uncharacterized protein n=1 Tax=Clitoria ternatea TaxID=43366 RepID=A0AAN9PJG2_CLITE
MALSSCDGAIRIWDVEIDCPGGNSSSSGNSNYTEVGLRVLSPHLSEPLVTGFSQAVLNSSSSPFSETEAFIPSLISIPSFAKDSTNGVGAKLK